MINLILNSRFIKPQCFFKTSKNVRSYIYYTTKIVPERYLLDNEGEDEKGGMAKVCDSAYFLCEIAHSAQGKVLKKVSLKETFDEKYL